MTFSAETSETSCSLDTPPNKTATLIFAMCLYSFMICESLLRKSKANPNPVAARTGVMPDTIIYPDTADFRTDLPPNSVYKTGKTDSSEDFSFSILS